MSTSDDKRGVLYETKFRFFANPIQRQKKEIVHIIGLYD